jgi:hypothetical protein
MTSSPERLYELLGIWGQSLSVLTRFPGVLPGRVRSLTMQADYLARAPASSGCRDAAPDPAR